MNDHQRKMARKAGASCGYVDGGVVGGVSAAIERVGRTFKTENGRRLIAADKAVDKDQDKLRVDVDKPIAKIQRMSTGRVDDAVDKAERGYAGGGKVKRGYA